MAEIDSLLCEHHKFITSLSIQPLNDLEKSEALLVSIQARVIEILNVAEQRRQELRTLIIEASKQKEQIIAYTAASHLTS